MLNKTRLHKLSIKQLVDNVSLDAIVLLIYKYLVVP
jgi:hypothetical protein